MGKSEKDTVTAIARYNDLCEYFGEAKNILNNSEEFKKWLKRIRWNCKKVDELARKMEYCEDAISRQAVFTLAKEECETAIIPYKRFIKDINALPPVTPKPKTGHWIRVTDKAGHLVWKCDKCDWQQRFNTNFCPDCGAEMESEDKK